MDSDNHGTIRKTFKNHFEQKHESNDKLDKRNNRKSNNSRFRSKSEQTIVREEQANVKASKLPNNVKYKTQNTVDAEGSPDTRKKDESNSIKADNMNTNVEGSSRNTSVDDNHTGSSIKKRSVKDQELTIMI